MRARLIIGTSLLLIGLPLLAMAEASSQEEAGTPSSTVRLQVTLPPDVTAPPEPKSFWDRLRSLLGVRRPVVIRPPIGTEIIVTASAYAPSPYQTDSTPCITAAGTRVRRGVVASNFLPLGTILSINNELFIVEDRMNSRYAGRYIDVWFPRTSDALEFGRQKLSITIVDYGQPGQALVDENEKEEARVVNVNQPTPTANTNFLDRLQQPFQALGSTVADLLGARSGGNPNRHDVDCFSIDE